VVDILYISCYFTLFALSVVLLVC